MGRKSGAIGNAYKNPVDNYRKQLGRNEERSSLYHRPKGGRKLGKPLSGRELARSKLFPKNWKSMIVYLVLFVGIMLSVYVLVVVEAGKYLYGLWAGAGEVGSPHAPLHRDT